MKKEHCLSLESSLKQTALKLATVFASWVDKELLDAGTAKRESLQIHELDIKVAEQAMTICDQQMQLRRLQLVIELKEEEISALSKTIKTQTRRGTLMITLNICLFFLGIVIGQRVEVQNVSSNLQKALMKSSTGVNHVRKYRN